MLTDFQNSFTVRIRRLFVIKVSVQIPPTDPGAVSCYPASMVNLIWFADENVHHMSALSNMGS